MPKCVQCTEQFELTDEQIDWFKNKGMTPPKRCEECRAKNRAEKEQRGE